MRVEVNKESANLNKYLRIAIVFLLIITVFTSLHWADPTPEAIAQAVLNDWEPVAKGIDYQEFFLPDYPNHVYVTRLDRHNPNVTLESAIAQGRLSGGLETVSGMSARYDQALNTWGEAVIPHDNTAWGSRNQVVVAINGYFFDYGTGIPWRGQVYSGWYAKRFDDLENGSGFAWTLERDAFIGECVKHVQSKQVVKFLETSNSLEITDINRSRQSDELILYTPQYDATTLTDNSGTEVLVEMSRPTLILPLPNGVSGQIVEVRVNKGSTPIPFDHIVLSGKGKTANQLKNNAHGGETILISQEIKHYQSNCSTPLSLDWTKTFASIGGSFYFLRDSEIQSFSDEGANIRNPRTAIAFNQDYIFFVVVDGRDRLNSVGMNMYELGLFTRDTLGASYGINQDGGGSSTMVVNGEVKNNPNADLIVYETYLPIIQQANTLGLQHFDLASSQSEVASLYRRLETAKKERAVANGMLMVVVLPKEQTSTFRVGEAVVVVGMNKTAVRLGPGLNYSVLAWINPGSPGQIIDHANRLNGVLAKDNYWWRVKLSNVTGWVAEPALNSAGQP